MRCDWSNGGLLSLPDSRGRGSAVLQDQGESKTGEYGAEILSNIQRIRIQSLVTLARLLPKKSACVLNVNTDYELKLGQVTSPECPITGSDSCQTCCHCQWQLSVTSDITFRWSNLQRTKLTTFQVLTFFKVILHANMKLQIGSKFYYFYM